MNEATSLALLRRASVVLETKKTGFLVSIAFHIAMLILLALLPAAEVVPSFGVINVRMVDLASLPSEEKAHPSVHVPNRNVQKSRYSHVRQEKVVKSHSPSDMETHRETVPDAATVIPDNNMQLLPVPTTATASSASKHATVTVISEAEQCGEEGNHGGGSTSASSVTGRSGTAASGTGSSVVETAFGEPNAPAFVHRATPVYPRTALMLGKEGSVVLKLFIDEEGGLNNVEVVKSSWRGFADAAIDALRKSSFVPASLNGRAVRSEALLSVRFNMDKGH